MLATLQPSLGEFGVMFLVDSIALQLFSLIDGRIFQRLYPETKFYFNGINFEALRAKPVADQLALYQSFLKLPRRRAIFGALYSYIKVIPGVLVILFYWERDVSFGDQFLLVLFAGSMNIAYFYGAIFIETHIFISDLIEKIHAEINWTRVFKEADVSRVPADFDFQEAITLLTLMGFTLGLQWMVVTSEVYQGTSLALLVTGIGAVGLILYSYLWWLGRRFLMGGLKDLVRRMDEIDYRSSDGVLSLHSTVLLARFEKSFNLLIDRLQKSEQETASWILREVEKSRYRTLGEMSALIAHDMGSSLHVIRFCVDQLKEDPRRVEDPAYLIQLETNVFQLVSLMDSLRARLKNVGPDAACFFMEAHSHTVRVLRTQYATQRFESIKFYLGPELSNLRLNMARVDLIHVLENLYRNSVENLISNEVANPLISIELVAIDGDTAILEISDNGTGLDAQLFEKLTAFSFVKNEKEQFSSLGLKLVRRLTELHGGSLDLAAPALENPGTTFQLRIKHGLTPIASPELQKEAGV